MQSLKVSMEESNQKLFNFLQRRLEVSQSQTHKWIRSGQVRINGKRCSAYDKVQADDEVRIPPFAVLKTCAQIENKKSISPSSFVENTVPLNEIIVYEDSDLLVINKPFNLAVQGGSKQDFSLVDLLKAHYTQASFAPTPAHRLDKQTSGILLIAKSYNMLQHIHTALQDKENAQVQKLYLAQVRNKASSKLLEGLWKDRIVTEKNSKAYEKICLTKDIHKGQEALSKVRILESSAKFSLLEIDLITGRKHQIRVQCAERNYPIIGDIKYGSEEEKNSKRMYLHAYKFIFDGQVFVAENKDFESVYGE